MREMEEDIRGFKDQMNYPNLIMRRINDIHDAIRRGEDGAVELTNLYSTLTKKIIDPVIADIQNVTTNLQHEISEIQDKKYPKNWSRNHVQNVINSQCRELNREAMQNIILIVMNRLDNLGMLVAHDRGFELGGNV